MFTVSGKYKTSTLKTFFPVYQILADLLSWNNRIFFLKDQNYVAFTKLQQYDSCIKN
jgi:hypothetical protein